MARERGERWERGDGEGKWGREMGKEKEGRGWIRGMERKEKMEELGDSLIDVKNVEECSVWYSAG